MYKRARNSLIKLYNGIITILFTQIMEFLPPLVVVVSVDRLVDPVQVMLYFGVHVRVTWSGTAGAEGCDTD